MMFVFSIVSLKLIRTERRKRVMVKRTDEIGGERRKVKAKVKTKGERFSLAKDLLLKHMI